MHDLAWLILAITMLVPSVKFYCRGSQTMFLGIIIQYLVPQVSSVAKGLQIGTLVLESRKSMIILQETNRECFQPL